MRKIGHIRSIDHSLRHRPQPLHARAVFSIDGRVCGMDLFDHPDTLSGLLAKLVGSYALDAADEGQKAVNVPETSVAQQFVRMAGDARFDPFPALGEGTDLRLDSSKVCGGALEARGRIVHLCVFPSAGEGGSGLRGSGRMAGLSARRTSRSVR